MLGALALLVRLPFILQSHRAHAGSDEEIFLGLSDTLLNDLRFDSDFYTPGYPAFAALLRGVPGRVEDAVLVVQHLIGVGVVVALVVVGWRWFGRASALIAGGLAAISPTLVVHEHLMLPDFLFGVLTCSGAVALAAGLRRDPPRTHALVGAGVLFGTAAWVKPAGIMLLAAAPLAALLAGRGLRASLRPAGIVTLTLVVAISPWLARNAIDRDLAGTSRQGGLTLFNRAFERDKLEIPSDHEYARFAEELRVQAAAIPDARFHKEFRDALEFELGVSYERTFAIEGEMARTAIRRQPLDYARGTWREFRGSAGYFDDFARDWELEGDLERRGPGVVHAAVRETWNLARVLTDLWWLLSFSTAAGLLTLVTGPPERRIAARALFAVWLCVILGTAMANGGSWLYTLQVAPIQWLLGSAGLVFVASAVADQLRSSMRAA
jgi:hypothetical protein